MSLTTEEFYSPEAFRARGEQFRIDRHGSRLAQVMVSVELLLDLITEGWEAKPGLRCTKGLPRDAELVRSYVSEDRGGTAFLVFRHESFPVWLPGQAILDLDVVHETGGA